MGVGRKGITDCRQIKIPWRRDIPETALGMHTGTEVIGKCESQMGRMGVIFNRLAPRKKDSDMYTGGCDRAEARK